MYYLTPAQLRALNLGVKGLEDKTDFELAPIIARATAAVNEHCNVPQLPAPHSFLGDTVTGETHTWSIDPYVRTPQRRVFPYHRPVIDILSMRIFATSTQYIEFNEAELYYEASEGWIEPASANLTSYGLFGSAVLPWVGLSEPYAQISYVYGYRFPKLERLWYAGNGGNTWRGLSGFWTDDPIEITVNGVAADSDDYTVDRTEGAITWTNLVTRPNGSDTVEADVISRQHPDIALATGLIAAQYASDQRLLSQGMPMGINSFRVAEVAVEREPRRFMRDPSPAIPPEASSLLEAFVYHPLGWA